MDFWLEQKNAEIRCSSDRFKNIEDHQTKKLTKSKIMTVIDRTLKIVMEPSCIKKPELTLSAKAQCTIKTIIQFPKPLVLFAA